MSEKRGQSRAPSKGYVEFFEDVFDSPFCTFLLKDAEAKLALGNEFARSNYQWSSNIVKASQPVLIRDYDPALSAIILGQLTRRGVIDTDDFQVRNYAWSRLSYIPWHNDGMHQVAITVFLNDVWERDWGGIFLYLDDRSGIRGYAPKFNTCLKNRGHILHSTTMITPDAAAPRLTLQIFPKKS
jgi:Rps23 Pro-64 3,4-dihydroxylase Tpa1-like proline 4-hydroxylase